MTGAVFRLVALGVGFLAVIGTSCSTSLAPRQDALVWGPLAYPRTFQLAEVTLATVPTWVDRRPLVRDLAEMAARESGVPWGTPAAGAEGYTLSLDLSEVAVGPDLDPVRSVTAILKIRDGQPGSEPLGEVVFCDTTRESLMSTEYLCRVLGEVFCRLAWKTGGIR